MYLKNNYWHKCSSTANMNLDFISKIMIYFENHCTRVGIKKELRSLGLFRQKFNISLMFSNFGMLLLLAVLTPVLTELLYWISQTL